MLEKMIDEKKYTGYGYHGGGRKAKGEEPRTCTLSIVCTASEKEKIIGAVKGLRAYGSTAGESGINLAYEQAEKNKIDGNNRIISGFPNIFTCHTSQG